MSSATRKKGKPVTDVKVNNRSMDYIDLPDRTTIVTSEIGSGVVAINRVSFEGERLQVGPPAIEEALLLHYFLKPQVADISIDGQTPVAHNMRAGTANILDFQRRYGGIIHRPFDMVGYHLPFSAFEDLAPDYRGRFMRGTTVSDTSEIDDEVVRHLSLALLPALRRPAEVNRLFVDHIGWALVGHVGRFYSAFEEFAWLARGRLALWQERRAKEMIEAGLSGNVPLADVASACGLSVGYFARAFRRTCGVAPHQWLMQRRVERAKQMLDMGRLPIAAIAADCGFADHSHLARVFMQMTGMSPGVWRRMNGRAEDPS